MNIKTSAQSESVFPFTEEKVEVMTGQIFRESLCTHLALHTKPHFKGRQNLSVGLL